MNVLIFFFISEFLCVRAPAVVEMNLLILYCLQPHGPSVSIPPATQATACRSFWFRVPDSVAAVTCTFKLSIYHSIY